MEEKTVKTIIKGNTEKNLGYCLGCDTQCNGKCKKQCGGQCTKNGK